MLVFQAAYYYPARNRVPAGGFIQHRLLGLQRRNPARNRRTSTATNDALARANFYAALPTPGVQFNGYYSVFTLLLIALPIYTRLMLI